MSEDSLYHHGIKGQKWGVRRFQDKTGKRTALGKARYSQTTPRKELENGDYLYKKGTVVGRFGGDTKWDQNSDITYLYTNEKDRSVYSKRFGGSELTYKLKKDVKMPTLQKQYTDLLEFVKNDDTIKDQYDYALNEPFDFWKDNINQGGNVADRYYSSMKNKGYDALIDFRNIGMTDDPIIVLSPKDSLEKVDNSINHAEEDDKMGYYDDYLEHHGILGQKWGVRRFENAQGHLTAAGKARYDGDKVSEKEKHAFSAKAAGHKALAKVYGANEKVYSKSNKTLASMNKAAKNDQLKKAEKAQKEADVKKAEKKGLTDKQKKMIAVGAVAVGTAVAAYGGYKLYQLNKQATEGLSNDYHKKATAKFTEANKLFAESEGNHSLGFKTYNNDLIKKSVEQNYKGHEKRAEAEALQDIAKSGKFSVGEKAAYLKLQKAKASNDDNLKAKKEVTKVLKDYNNKQNNWYKKTTELEQQKRMAERIGNTAAAAKIDKKLASSPPPIPPQFSKKGQAATNKLASEASVLAKSVTAEGPKSFSSSAQNGQSKQQLTQQKLQAAQRAVSSGTKTVSSTMRTSGQTKFNQAAKANDDLVAEMLKKNAQSLKGF